VIGPPSVIDTTGLNVPSAPNSSTPPTLPESSAPPVTSTPPDGRSTAADSPRAPERLPVTTQVPVSLSGIEPRSMPDDNAAAATTTRRIVADFNGPLRVNGL
jgi:hypothetical protein